jgi:hypothetical protein
LRIALIVVASLVLLIVLVVVIGALLPKRHVASRSATYHATPDQLFALIAGPQNWRPDVLSSEAVLGQDGKEFQRETSRRNETITYEILDRIPPKSIKRRIATKNLPYSGTWTYTLEAAGDSTTVRITEEGEVTNPLFRFVSRFILGHTRTIDTYLQSLANATNQNVEIKD